MKIQTDVWTKHNPVDCPVNFRLGSVFICSLATGFLFLLLSGFNATDTHTQPGGVVGKQEDNTHVDLMLWSNLRPCPEALLESCPLGLQRRHTNTRAHMYTCCQQGRLGHHLIPRKVIEVTSEGDRLWINRSFILCNCNFILFLFFFLQDSALPGVQCVVLQDL